MKKIEKGEIKKRKDSKNAKLYIKKCFNTIVNNKQAICIDFGNHENKKA